MNNHSHRFHILTAVASATLLVAAGTTPAIAQPGVLTDETDTTTTTIPGINTGPTTPSTPADSETTIPGINTDTTPETPPADETPDIPGVITDATTPLEPIITPPAPEEPTVPDYVEPPAPEIVTPPSPEVVTPVVPEVTDVTITETGYDTVIPPLVEDPTTMQETDDPNFYTEDTSTPPSTEVVIDVTIPEPITTPPATPPAATPPAPAGQSDFQQTVTEFADNINHVARTAGAPPTCGDGFTPVCDTMNTVAQVADAANQAINPEAALVNTATAFESNTAVNNAITTAAEDFHAGLADAQAQAQDFAAAANSFVAGIDSALNGVR